MESNVPEELFLMRSERVYNMWNYYATGTDVWVYSTSDGFREFASLIRTSREPVRRVGQPGSMDLLLLPPCPCATRDFLVIQERAVYQQGRHNMELIVGGTREGLDRVANRMTRQEKAAHEQDHVHIDADFEELLVLPAVSLNIRGPLAPGDWLEMTRNEGKPRLPQDTLLHEEPYKLLDYPDLYGWIPISG